MIERLHAYCCTVVLVAKASGDLTYSGQGTPTAAFELFQPLLGDSYRADYVLLTRAFLRNGRANKDNACVQLA